MRKLQNRMIEIVLFSAVGILISVLLLYLWLTPNVESFQSRNDTGYTVVADVSYSEIQEDGKMVRQFRFVLDDSIAYDTNLIFRFNHQEAEVYLDGTLVYSLHTSDSLEIVRTPGGQWAMIPLFREDVGKEVLVQLRPVYDRYQNQQIQFLIGSRLSVYTDTLLSALPEMLFSLGDLFAGALLFAIAAYFSGRKNSYNGLYSLGLLAISLALWNFTQTNFAPLILPEKTIFLYYLSVTMLDVSVFALIKAIRPPKTKRAQYLLEGWTLLYGLFALIQLILQLLGIRDLRETLEIIHGALFLTAGILIIGNLLDWWKVRKTTGEQIRVDAVWILGVGVLLDLLNYYRGSTRSQLIFVLLAVLCYVLLNAFWLIVAYSRQKQALDEKETQLTMSRITTMMSQIRSHFVFNVLNAISGMCKYDPEKADETVVRFSRYLRSNIDIMEDDKNVPFLQEMERLEDYVVLEQIRFGDRIEFTTDIQADHFSIPPLILQPIVENAIKHGISKRKEGGRIALSTRDTGSQILITVTDNGIGFPMDALDQKTSVGLRNIRFRLYHLVGGTMDIKSQLGQGTTVTLTIPKEESDESDLCRR